MNRRSEERTVAAWCDTQAEPLETVRTNGWKKLVAIARGPSIAQCSGEFEWYTPRRYVNAVRRVLGEIDLDPASSTAANLIVGAKTFYSVTENGLERPWFGRVFMNPPYSSDLIGIFIDRIVEHHERGDIDAAVVLVNNATDTRWFGRLFDAASALCFTDHRIRFESRDGAKGSPVQGQAFGYLGQDPGGFVEVFRSIGHCVYTSGNDG